MEFGTFDITPSNCTEKKELVQRKLIWNETVQLNYSGMNNSRTNLIHKGIGWN